MTLTQFLMLLAVLITPFGMIYLTLASFGWRSVRDSLFRDSLLSYVAWSIAVFSCLFGALYAEQSILPDVAGRPNEFFVTTTARLLYPLILFALPTIGVGLVLGRGNDPAGNRIFDAERPVSRLRAYKLAVLIHLTTFGMTVGLALALNDIYDKLWPAIATDAIIFD